MVVAPADQAFRMNNFEQPYKWWLVQEIHEIRLKILLRLAKDQRELFVLHRKEEQATKWQLSEWTYENSKEESCSLMRYNITIGEYLF